MLKKRNKKGPAPHQISFKKKFGAGFTLLFAALVGALVLAVGMAILGITIKQLTLASAGKATQQAFYSADAGVECALYLDRGAGIPECRLGFFPIPDDTAPSGYSSCLDKGVSATNMHCMGKDISLNNTHKDVNGNVITEFFLDDQYSPDSNDNTQSGATYDGMCFSVVVTKMADNNSPLANATIIESRGYNTCNEQAVNRFERAIRSVNQ